jgi:NADH-quinone oxidoreductase subunit C
MNFPLKENLAAAFDGIGVEIEGGNRTVIRVKKEAILSVLSFLKSHGYGHLALISCVDWIEENAFELVYVLSAYMQEDESHTDKERMNLILKTRIPRERPSFLSVIPVFENAEPYEREIHELFGVVFEGHPRLTPLFLEREYEIPPFRKDFDTRQYVKDVFDSIPAVEKEEGSK